MLLFDKNVLVWRKSSFAKLFSNAKKVRTATAMVSIMKTEFCDEVAQRICKTTKANVAGSVGDCSKTL